MSLALTAFLTGLFSGVHCVAMCGGVVSALSLPRGRETIRIHADGSAAMGSTSRLPIQVAYSSGRIASYAIAGTIAGGVGGTMLLAQSALPIQLLLAAFANVLLIALGLYLAGIGGAVVRLERLGAPLWRRIAPFTRRWLPADTPPRAFAVGMLWGWLPCGLVYSTLALALMSGGPVEGATVMFAFGLGTLPNLVAAGLAVERLRPVLQRQGVRRAAGALVASLGVWGLARIPQVADAVREGLLCLT